LSSLYPDLSLADLLGIVFASLPIGNRQSLIILLQAEQYINRGLSPIFKSVKVYLDADIFCRNGCCISFALLFDAWRTGVIF